ncbi:MAG: NAD(P)H:quinone oxidoreductase [Candidatus Thorarchaeota archaeon]
MKILVLYYSSYGHIFNLAQEIVIGALSAGAKVDLKRVPELTPKEIIDNNPGLKHGAEIQNEVPIAEISELPNYDAIIFGSPTRYGNMTAQMKNFIDQTGPLWMEGKLANKIAGVFTGSATMHGGQETTNLTIMITLMHHGMIIVPLGYTIPEVSTTVAGGTPYGPSVLAGPDGSRQADDVERKIAREYGKRIAEVTRKFVE